MVEGVLVGLQITDVFFIAPLLALYIHFSPRQPALQPSSRLIQLLTSAPAGDDPSKAGVNVRGLAGDGRE